MIPEWSAWVAVGVMLFAPSIGVAVQILLDPRQDRVPNG